jgi:hypothetical protein
MGDGSAIADHRGRESNYLTLTPIAISFPTGSLVAVWVMWYTWWGEGGS